MHVGMLTIHPRRAHEQWELIGEVRSVGSVAHLDRFIGTVRIANTKEDICFQVHDAIVAVGK